MSVKHLCVVIGVLVCLAVLALVLPAGPAALAGHQPQTQLGTLMPLASPFATYIPPEVATQIPQPPPSGGGGDQQQPPTSTPLPTDTPEPSSTPVPPPVPTPTVAPLPTPKPTSSGPCPASVALIGATLIAAVATGYRRRP